MNRQREGTGTHKCRDYGPEEIHKNIGNIRRNKQIPYTNLSVILPQRGYSK